MRNSISTSLRTILLLTAAVIISFSCSKDDEEYTFTFTSPAQYFTFGAKQTVTYIVSSNVRNISISSQPAGWSAEVNTSTRTVTVTAPVSLDQYQDDDDKTVTPVNSGTLVLRGDVGDKSVTASYYVSLGNVEDLTAIHVNCFIITKPETGYRFSAVRPDGSAVTGIESAAVAWASERYLIRYVDCKDGKITFTTNDNDDGELMEGNALIAARNAEGEILWCWHLWVTAAQPEENAVQMNGYTFMGCNLGAFGNSTDDNDLTLASYGLYYQWGRPSPFPRPRNYNCAGSATQYMYDSELVQVTMAVEEFDAAQYGSIEAALASPLTFVTGLEQPWQSANGGLTWRDDVKTVYDPCPAGWRVPQSSAFAGVTIDAAELTGDMDTLGRQYGWTLTDGAQSAFFFAGGRRSYYNGAVINMNTQETPKPWEGFYWSSTIDASRTTAAGLFFDLDTESAGGSRIVPARSLHLSTGLQIRCVKEQ